MNRDQRGQHTVHQTFRNLIAILIEDRIDGHQVTHVTDEHQAATFERQLTAICRGVGAIAVHLAGNLLTAFLEAFFQIALHQTQPVAIHNRFVVSINCCNRVFAIHNGGQCRFDQHIFYVSTVVFTDRMAGINLDFKVHAILDQQNTGRLSGRAGEANEAGFVFQTRGLSILELDDQLAAFDQILDGILVASVSQRCGGIQHVAGILDHFRATYRIVAATFLGAVFF